MTYCWRWYSNLFADLIANPSDKMMRMRRHMRVCQRMVIGSTAFAANNFAKTNTVPIHCTRTNAYTCRYHNLQNCPVCSVEYHNIGICDGMYSQCDDDFQHAQTVWNHRMNISYGKLPWDYDTLMTKCDLLIFNNERDMHSMCEAYNKAKSEGKLTVKMISVLYDAKREDVTVNIDNYNIPIIVLNNLSHNHVLYHTADQTAIALCNAKMVYEICTGRVYVPTHTVICGRAISHRDVIELCESLCVVIIFYAVLMVFVVFVRIILANYLSR